MHATRSDSDRLELLTVGIDVGSATFHLSVSRVVLARRAQDLSSRYDVVAREALVTSPAAFTPYVGSDEIDASAVDAAVRRVYAEGGVDPDEIDTGVVLLTGSALLRRNARALAERLAGSTGRFVCAAAGHHFEAVLAAHGSGAVARSRKTPHPVVALDLGGATTKFALARDGELRATAAIGVGSRLLAWDPAHRLVRVEGSVSPFTEAVGVAPELGREIGDREIAAICDLMAEAIVAQLLPREMSRPAAAMSRLTDAFPTLDQPFDIVASGGVAEYLFRDGEDDGPGRAFDRENPMAAHEIGERHDASGTDHFDDPGDLGPFLAGALLARFEAVGLAPRLFRGEQRIRATVIGASQFSTQVSGSTISVDPVSLPLHHVPVVRPVLDLGAARTIDPVEVASAIGAAVTERFSTEDVPGTLAVSLRWRGDPSHARLRAVAAGLTASIEAAGVEVLVVAVDSDVASSIGRIMATELGVTRAHAVCVDGVELTSLDFVDLGRPIHPAKVVPIVVKSLLFASAGSLQSRGTAGPATVETADGVPAESRGGRQT